MTSVAERLLTADEFMRLPDDPSGGKMELAYGQVVTYMPVGGVHGKLVARFTLRLGLFIEANALGELAPESGFLLRRDPDLVRAPDCAFLAAARVPAGGMPTGFIPGPPTLAIEVVSPGDTNAEVLHKVGEYLDAGTERVWVVRPDDRRVDVFRPGAGPVSKHEGDALTSDDAGFAADGFVLPIAELFASIPREP